MLCSVVNCEFTIQTNMQHDETTGTYYMDTYIGSKLEKKTLLIDTLANGTAIDYEVGNSKDAKVYPD